MIYSRWVDIAIPPNPEHNMMYRNWYHITGPVHQRKTITWAYVRRNRHVRVVALHDSPKDNVIIKKHVRCYHLVSTSRKQTHLKSGKKMTRKKACSSRCVFYIIYFLLECTIVFEIQKQCRLYPTNNFQSLKKHFEPSNAVPEPDPQLRIIMESHRCGTI